VLALNALWAPKNHGQCSTDSPGCPQLDIDLSSPALYL
jgi:hypothetical protein